MKYSGVGDTYTQLVHIHKFWKLEEEGEKGQLECERFPALGGEYREAKVHNFYCNCFSER